MLSRTWLETTSWSEEPPCRRHNLRISQYIVGLRRTLEYIFLDRTQATTPTHFFACRKEEPGFPAGSFPSYSTYLRDSLIEQSETHVVVGLLLITAGE